MSIEEPQGSVPSDDNFKLWFVPEGSDPTSAAILEGGGATAITYALKVFTPTGDEVVIDDPRLTLKQTLQRFGKYTETLSIQYVFGSDDDIAYPLLKRGVKGYLVSRYSVPNASDAEAAQPVDIRKIECGKQVKDVAVENGVQTITQKLVNTAPIRDDVPLVA